MPWANIPCAERDIILDRAVHDSKSRMQRIDVDGQVVVHLYVLCVV